MLFTFVIVFVIIIIIIIITDVVIVGICRYIDGDVFEGEFINNKLCGKGIIIIFIIIVIIIIAIIIKRGLPSFQRRFI